MLNILSQGINYSEPDGMAEWLRRETSEPGVQLKSLTVQPSCLVWAGTLVALYKCEGLFVVLQLAQ